MDDNAPHPTFCTPEGADVPPPEADKWWLTNVSRRKAEEAGATAPAGDEDGPVSDGTDIEENDDVIDPVLPIEDDDPYNDEDGDAHADSFGFLQAPGYTHSAKDPDPPPAET